jgi:hypothetical protein
MMIRFHASLWCFPYIYAQAGTCYAESISEQAP